MDAARGNGYFADGLEPKRMTFWGNLGRIQSLSERCALVGIALDTYFQEITRPGLVSVHRGRERNASPAQYTFITDLVRNLILYGWSAFREIERPEGSEQFEQQYQVPEGCDVAIRYDKDMRKWVADRRGNTITDRVDENFDAEKTYDLIILQPPTERTPVSFGQRATIAVERLLHFEKCQRNREDHNSQRECYVYVDNSAISTTSSGMPWLNSSIPSGSALGSSDYDQLVQNRIDMLRAFRQTTETRRHETGPQGRVGAGLPTGEIARQQHEFPISDGYRPIEARHLPGPTNENDTLRMLGYQVWEAMGVPPSAVGHVPNKERASGAERATGSALDSFRTTSQHIANCLKPAMDKAKLKLGIKVRPEVFKEVFPMLKTDMAVRIMEAVFNVPAENFDEGAVREMQTLKRTAPQGRGGQSGDNDDDKGSKVQKSVLEQDVSVAKKTGE